jgi:hypothetical protein
VMRGGRGRSTWSGLRVLGGSRVILIELYDSIHDALVVDRNDVLEEVQQVVSGVRRAFHVNSQHLKRVSYKIIIIKIIKNNL